MDALSLPELTPWLISIGVAAGKAAAKIALIFALGLAGMRFLGPALKQLESLVARTGRLSDVDSDSSRKRAATLTGILRTVVVSLIWGVVIIETLEEIGVDIRPILAGAGIVGLAVGFGAQNLVRDLISGFFIILEDQIRLGDVAIINGTGGLVESITFRAITLRDVSGGVHIFPNGTITTLSNMTKEWSAFVLDMGVAYREDTDRVAGVMREVGEDLRQDQDFRDKFMSPIEIMGVDNFADSAVVIRIRIKTKPLEQWNVGREYRRRLKQAFDAQGIEIPFPHRTIHWGEPARGQPSVLHVADARTT
ncbi:MAG: mechanosensitive ion channel family protein [Nitrospiraceae bacterium]|jgi:small conductance mechanosensitive channel|uniref:mechanosensitive ion channel family protein n=1 Tax=Nitrospira cf. moscoviensis SBR1015 TaxID=96242 RepID=UPI000A0B6A25|nr:mechanosensitive ion channel family protein [Nitrospira cf. moscoviensis SBR1015]MBX9658145.1 mechanosensitive ion channel family protein [Nitrospiraceae bacterium]OQW29989.1 MAG: mechanosensitive ion channel protein MscS [Nitrospira sp. SG-bin2]